MSVNKTYKTYVIKVASVTQEGIKVNGVLFSCGFAIKNNWFQNPEQFLAVFYFPEDLNKIYIPCLSGIFIAHALNPVKQIDPIDVLVYQEQIRRLKELKNKGNLSIENGVDFSEE